MALDFASLRRRSWNLKLPVIPLPDLPNRTYDDIQFVYSTTIIKSHLGTANRMSKKKNRSRSNNRGISDAGNRTSTSVKTGNGDTAPISADDVDLKSRRDSHSVASNEASVINASASESRDTREISRKAAEKRHRQNRNEWRRALRLFWLKNRTMITIMIAVFIVVEGSVAWFYPSQWWKPVIAAASVSVVLILWRNMKAAFKCVVSLGLTIMMAALAVQSGYAYGGMNTAALWGTAVLTGWALAVLISYVAHPMTSRWTISLVSAAMGFMMGYTFMPAGMIAIGLASVLGAIFMEASFLLGEALRRKMGAFKPAKEWQIKEYGRLQKTMKSLWPGMKAVGLKILGTWSTTVWYGVNCPTIVMIPLDLTESFRDTKRWGLVYRHRNIQPMAVWLITKAARIVREPAPVVVFVDQNGVNEASKGSAETMGFKLNDSINYVYAGILDGSETSVSALRKTMTDLVKRFHGLDYATAKQVEKLDKYIGKDWTRHLTKELKTHTELAMKISGKTSEVTATDGKGRSSVKTGAAGKRTKTAGSGETFTNVRLDRNGHEVREESMSKDKQRALAKALDRMDL